MNTTAEERLEALRAMQTPMLARDATLRDMFAGMALQGINAAPMNRFPTLKDETDTAVAAYHMADAMLAARKEAK